MQNNQTELLKEVASYYSEKLIQYGEVPQGVDWNSKESQTLRFEQLSKIVDSSQAFTLNDLGCGYGALYEFLQSKFHNFSYCGIDISKEMIGAAINRYKKNSNADFMNSAQPDKSASYGVASGIFNVRLGYSDEQWRNYLETTLDMLEKTSELGFAFNCLTAYSDEDKKRDYLYYADPCWLFDLCKKRYSRQVALLHDYGLYEFTILVRKK